MPILRPPSSGRQACLVDKVADSLPIAVWVVAGVCTMGTGVEDELVDGLVANVTGVVAVAGNQVPMDEVVGVGVEVEARDV